MKKLLLVIALLVSATMLADTNPPQQELLITSKQQANIFRHEVEPFQLEVDFRARFAKDLQGHLTRKWKAKDRWWRRIVMEGFEQIDIRNGEMLYTKRNIAFTPIRIKELLQLLQPAHDSEQLIAKKQKQGVDSGVPITCVQAEGKAPARLPHEICLNPATHDLLSDTVPVGDQRKRIYSEYFSFSAFRYPEKLEFRVNGSTVITATVRSLSTASLDDSLFVAPKGWIERRQCPDMQPAVPIKAPEPISVESALQNNMSGDITAVMTVLTDGTVGEIQVIGDATRSLKDAALKTLKTWKFKPARCGQEPVVSDYEFGLEFRPPPGGFVWPLGEPVHVR